MFASQLDDGGKDIWIGIIETVSFMCSKANLQVFVSVCPLLCFAIFDSVVYVNPSNIIVFYKVIHVSNPLRI